MLTGEQLETLQQIETAVAFDDGTKTVDLVMEGYVEKNGDLFELTAKGAKALLDNGCASSLG